MIKIVAEIGINHNGSLDIVKKLIDAAVLSGCDYVKFQKRNPDTSTPEHQKYKIKNSIWGPIRYIDYKKKLEFGENEYDSIENYCNQKKINWFASAWDLESVDFLKKYKNKDLGVFIKIPSACITNLDLLKYVRKNSDFLAISTGMSTEEEVKNAIELSRPDLIFHTNSSYPSPFEEINLNYINWLKNIYPKKLLGYSGHELGYIPTITCLGMGVTWIERHITLDKNMIGSDHSSSLDSTEFSHLVSAIKTAESSIGFLGPRKITPGEFIKKDSLRKPTT
jgi:N-acetylneuraminate synthase